MKKWPFLLMSGLALSVSALVSTQTFAQDDSSDEGAAEEVDRSDWPETVRFAVAGMEGTEELQRRYEEFAATFEELLGMEIEFYALSDRLVSSAAVEHDHVDLVLSGPSEYVVTKDAKPDIQLAGGIERDDYYVVFIASKESGIESLEDAVGETIAMKDTGSTSGHIGPTGVLIEEGYDIDNDFDIIMLGDASLEALLNGEVDVMADGVKHWNTIVEEGREDDFVIIYEGEPLPADPFIVNTTMPENFAEEFVRIITENEEEVLRAIIGDDQNDKFEGGSIIEVLDEDFDNLRETYELLGLEFEE